MAFGGFVDEFTNSPVQPAFSTYLNLNLAGNVALDWSAFTATPANPFSQLVQVVTNTSAGNIISLPDATLSSVQQTMFLANSSGTPFVLKDFAGNDIISAATAGTVYFIALTDNTTQAGTWFQTQFGGTINPNDAAALVGVPGYGLIAESGLIKLDFKATTIDNTGIPYNVTNNDRGHLLNWVAGSSFLNLPAANSVTNGFVFSTANISVIAGGIETVHRAGADTINDVAEDFPLLLNESCFFVSDGVSNWTTLGFSAGGNSSFQTNAVPLNSNAIAVTSAQAASALQKFVTGTAVGPITITYPSGLAQNYIMWNTSSANNITVKVSGGTNSYFLLPGDSVAVYSDGTDLYPLSQKIYAANDTASNPSFTFLNSPTTGFYSPALGQVGVSCGGAPAAIFNNSGFFSFNPVLTSNGTALLPSFSFVGDPDTGFYSSGVNHIGVSCNGALVAEFTPAGFVFTGGIVLPDGSAAAPSLTFIGAPTTGFFGSATTIGMSIGGVKMLDLIANQLQVADGTNLLPAYSFINAPTIGLYNNGSKLELVSTNEMDFIFNGFGVQTILSLTTTSLTSTVPILTSDGAVNVPSFSFAGDPDTGFYSVAANIIGVSCNGGQVAEFTTTGFITNQQILLPIIASGFDNTKPALAFNTGTFNTGLYGNATNIDLTISGTQAFGLTATQMITNVGTVAAPGYSFISNPTSGMYFVGGNLGLATPTEIDFTINNVPKVTLTTSTLTSIVPVVIPSGTALAPSLYFAGSPTTGFYGSSGTISMTLASSPGFTLTLTQLIATNGGSSTLPGYSFVGVGANSSGMYFSGGNLGLGTSTEIDLTIGGVPKVTLITSALTSNIPVVIPAGSAAAPSLAFTGALTTGLYATASDLQMAIGTVPSFDLTSAQMRTNVGTATNPGYSFIGNTSSGMYFVASKLGLATPTEIDFSISGSTTVSISTTLTSTVPVIVPTGSSAAPSLAFAGATTTGLYGSSTDLQMAIGTTPSFDLTSTQMRTNVGTVAAPGYSFIGNTSSGMYYVGGKLGLNTPTEIDLSIGNTAVVTILSTSVTSTTPIIIPVGSVGTPSLAFTGATNTGFYEAASAINISLGGAQAYNFSTNQLSTNSFGTQTAPVYSFNGQSTSGMYFAGGHLGLGTPTQIDLSIGATAYVSLTAANLSFLAPLFPASTPVKTTSFDNLSPTITAGDMIYKNAALNNVRLPIGTAGQPLVVTPTSLIPEWAGFSILKIATTSSNPVTGNTTLSGAVFQALPGMSVTIAPTYIGSRMLIYANVSMQFSTSAGFLNLNRGGAPICQGVGSGTGVSSTVSNPSSTEPSAIPIVFLDIATTSLASITYTITAAQSGGGNTYFNKASPAANYDGQSSTFYVIEIGGF